MNKKKLFLIHNHKNFSGAARSLGETIISLKNKVEFTVICPTGSSSKFFKSLNIRVIEVYMVPRFNHFELGYYKGLRWLLLIREFVAFIYFFYFLVTLKIQKSNISQFHLNEIELVILAPLLKLFFNASISSHLRCPIETKKGKKRFRLLKSMCRKYISNIIAIDKDCFKTSPLKKISSIIYNGINKKNILVKKNKSKYITFGFIGNFIKRKGIYEALEVFSKIKDKHNTKLICVGDIKKKNFLLNFFGFERDFKDYVKKKQIMKIKNIKILPMTFDLRKFYSKIDVILFPGYMNAVGRPVIEASLLKKPSIIALKNYNSDTAMKNNCLVFYPGDLNSFEQKIIYLVKNKHKIKKMGISSFKNARKYFDIKKNSKTFFELIWK